MKTKLIKISIIVLSIFYLASDSYGQGLVKRQKQRQSQRSEKVPEAKITFKDKEKTDE